MGIPQGGHPSATRKAFPVFVPPRVSTKVPPTGFSQGGPRWGSANGGPDFVVRLGSSDHCPARFFSPRGFAARLFPPRVLPWSGFPSSWSLPRRSPAKLVSLRGGSSPRGFPYEAIRQWCFPPSVFPSECLPQGCPPESGPPELRLPSGVLRGWVPRSGPRWVSPKACSVWGSPMGASSNGVPQCGAPMGSAGFVPDGLSECASQGCPQGGPQFSPPSGVARGGPPN